MKIHLKAHVRNLNIITGPTAKQLDLRQLSWWRGSSHHSHLFMSIISHGYLSATREKSEYHIKQVGINITHNESDL